MKILSVSLYNIASIEGPFTIDLEAEPLKSAGLFAITGATGAGKSTILDAICLALYNDTPRLATTKVNQLITDGNSDLQVNNVKNLLRKGAISGYAKVTFQAIDNKIYEAEWQVRRARGKQGGSLQSETILLYNCTDNEPFAENRKTIVLERIKELIGLTFDEFTKSVILAQGDFTSFLKADDNKRSDILEKLTGTEIYTQISQKIYEIYKQHNYELSLLEAQRKNTTFLSEEEKEQIKTHLATDELNLEKLQAEIALLSEQQKWFADEQQFIRQYNEALAIKEKAIDEKEREATRFAELAMIEAIQAIKQEVVSKQQEAYNLIAIKQQIDKDKAEKENLSSEEKTLLSNLTTYQKDFTELNEQYKQDKPVIEKAKKLDILIAETERTLAEKELQLQNKEKKLAKKEAEAALVAENIKKGENYKQEREAWLSAHINQVVIKDNYHWLLNLATEKKTLQTYIEKNKQELAMLNTEPLQEEVKVLETELTSAQQELPIAQAAYQTAERIVQKTQLENSHNIVLLRQNLTEGEACPVCGSLHHPNAQQEVQEQLIKVVEKERDDAKQKVNELTKTIAAKAEKLLKQHNALNELIAQKEKIKSRSEEYQQRIKDYRAQLQELALTEEWITLWETTTNTFIENINLLKQKWDKEESSLQKAKERLQKLANDKAALTAEITTLQQDIIPLQKTLQIDSEQHMALKAERTGLLDNKPAQEVEMVYEKKLKDLVAVIDEAQNAYNTLLLNITANETSLSSLTAQKEQTEKTLTAATDAIEQWVTTHYPTQKMYLYQHLDKWAAYSHEWLQQERTAYQALNERIAKYTTIAEEQQKALQAHSKKKPLTLSESETKEAYQSKKETQEALHTAVINYKSQLLNDAAQQKAMQVLLQQIAQKEEITKQWGQLNNLIGSSNGANFRRYAQEYTLDLLLQYANMQMKLINRRYTLQRIAGTLGLQVIDNDMAAEIRSVYSLSGGESFLVSLALALALSSLSSTKMNVETLFIDEGFGSLDAETLQVALDALERLQNQGKKVGVISHIQEMVERIAVKVEVQKEGNGKSRITING